MDFILCYGVVSNWVEGITRIWVSRRGLGGLPYFPESVDARTTIRGRDEEEGEMEAWVSG